MPIYEFVRNERLYLISSIRWHEARIVAYEQLSLRSNKIESYLEAPDRIKHLVNAYNTDLTVDLTGLFERNESLLVEFNTSKCVDRTIAILAHLSIHLKCMKRMRGFRLQFLEFFNQSHTNNMTMISTLLADLPRNLSRLTFDCCNDYPMTQGQSMCPSSLLLNKDRVPSLRHLRLRNRFICPRIFDTICSSGESQLETLIINTSLKVEQSCPPMNKVFFTKECHPDLHGQLHVPGTGGAIIPQDSYQFLGSSGWHGSGDLGTRLSNAANAILPRLKRIKVLRILRHKLPSDDVISYDVLSDRSVILPKNANWEDADCHNEGEPDPDCEGRSENSFSSSYYDESE